MIQCAKYVRRSVASVNRSVRSIGKNAWLDRWHAARYAANRSPFSGVNRIISPSGAIDANGTRVLLETSGDFPNVRAIETMLTRVGTTDSLVRLADLVAVPAR